jgi:hypothetical protein
LQHGIQFRERAVADYPAKSPSGPSMPAAVRRKTIAAPYRHRMGRTIFSVSHYLN